MRVVLQRVLKASVTIDGKLHSAINQGLLLLVGVEEADTEEDITWLSSKIVNQRIFSDENGKMNLSVKDIDGDVLAVSQFTLFASTKKGNRPSFIDAAAPQKANDLYDSFCSQTSAILGKPVQKGVFAADMKVELINDGPVTILLDSKRKE